MKVAVRLFSLIFLISFVACTGGGDSSSPATPQDQETSGPTIPQDDVDELEVPTIPSDEEEEEAPVNNEEGESTTPDEGDDVVTTPPQDGGEESTPPANNEEEEEGPTQPQGIISAKFVDAPTQGIWYYEKGESLGTSKQTDADGNFECEAGVEIEFSLRPGYGARLGTIICGEEIVFPMDLIGGDLEHAKLIALLFHHLDDRFSGQLDCSSGKCIDAINGTDFNQGLQINGELLRMMNTDVPLTPIAGRHIIPGTINSIRMWKLNNGYDTVCPDPSILTFEEQKECPMAPNYRYGTYAYSEEYWFSDEFTTAIAQMEIHLTQSCKTYGQNTKSCEALLEKDSENEE